MTVFVDLALGLPSAMSPVDKKIAELEQEARLLKEEIAVAKRDPKTTPPASAFSVTPNTVGPDAVPVDATTMLDIQRAQERLLELAMGLRKPGPGELQPGEVPKVSGGPWQTGDHFGKEPPLGQNINGSDPSGARRFRGPG